MTANLCCAIRRTKLISEYADAEFNRVTEGPDGTLWLGSTNGLFSLSGGKFRVFDRRNGLPANKINSIAIDSANRLWVGTEFGMAVQKSAGSADFEIVLPSTSALPEAVISGIYVSGAPTLPAAEASPKTASISGRISEDGKAMADTEIQLCAGDYDATVRNTGSTPCEVNLWSAVAKAGKDGTFKFENVPLGSYKYAIRRPGSDWSAIILFSQDINVFEPGQDVVFDMKFTKK
jgi:hypothetical protein